MESCRQDEMDMAPENTRLVQKEKQKTTYQKTENDTVKTASNLQFDDSGVEIADPPQKIRISGDTNLSVLFNTPSVSLLIQQVLGIDRKGTLNLMK